MKNEALPLAEIEALLNEYSPAHRMDAAFIERWEAQIAPWLTPTHLFAASLSDAERMLNWAWAISMAQNDPSRGLSMLEIYFSHPDFSESDPIFRNHFQSAKIATLFRLGAEAEALHEAVALLEAEPTRLRRTSLFVLTGMIQDVCCASASKELASASLTTVVEEIVRRLRRWSPRIRRLPTQATFEELRTHLDQVYTRPRTAKGPS